MLRDTTEKIKANVEKVIVGKGEIIDFALVALLCEGHILLEDVPGIGKTTLAKCLARSLGCSFRRIQFTPDLLPSDVTGISFFNQKEQAFAFRPDRYLPRSCWPMRSTGPLPARKALCWRPCRNGR